MLLMLPKAWRSSLGRSPEISISWLKWNQMCTDIIQGQYKFHSLQHRNFHIWCTLEMWKCENMWKNVENMSVLIEHTKWHMVCCQATRVIHASHRCKQGGAMHRRPGALPRSRHGGKDLLRSFFVSSVMFDPFDPDPHEVGPGISIRNSCQNYSNVALRSCSKDIWLTSARARAMAAWDHQNGRPGHRKKTHLRKWRLQPAHRFLVPWP